MPGDGPAHPETPEETRGRALGIRQLKQEIPPGDQRLGRQVEFEIRVADVFQIPEHADNVVTTAQFGGTVGESSPERMINPPAAPGLGNTRRCVQPVENGVGPDIPSKITKATGTGTHIEPGPWSGKGPLHLSAFPVYSNAAGKISDRTANQVLVHTVTVIVVLVSRIRAGIRWKAISKTFVVAAEKVAARIRQPRVDKDMTTPPAPLQPETAGLALLEVSRLKAGHQVRRSAPRTGFPNRFQEGLDSLPKPVLK